MIAGGKGNDDDRHFAATGKAETAFLIDVDDCQSVESHKMWPKAKYYHDWHEMFDKEDKHFYAVDAGIPDHNHATVEFARYQRRRELFEENDPVVRQLTLSSPVTVVANADINPLTPFVICLNNPAYIMTGKILSEL